MGQNRVPGQLPELFVIFDGNVDMLGLNDLFALSDGKGSGQVEHLADEVLEHGGRVHGGVDPDPQTGGFFELVKQPPDWERDSGPSGQCLTNFTFCCGGRLL